MPRSETSRGTSSDRKPIRGNVIATVGAPLLHARQAYERRSWATAFGQFSAADRAQPLEPADLERFALAAYLSGHDEACEPLWTRAYHDLEAHGEIERAARCAFWQGMTLFNRGQSAAGGGWMAKARRLLDDHQRDCAERGYLLVPGAVASAIRGDFQSAAELFEQAAAIGDRFGDHDLRALARQSRGRALTMLGRIDEGVALFDEVMVAVTADELSPIAAGVVYCNVIEACTAVFDLKRAQEWTAALGRWCDTQPDLVPYHVTCLARRSEILQLNGRWDDALREAAKACERVATRSHLLGAGLAFYQLGEMHRLRGDFPAAAAAYRSASEHGKSPEPGHALLCLAEGNIAAAVAAIRRCRGEAQDRKARARALLACVEVSIAAGDVAAAREAANELEGEAAQLEVPLIRAFARRAMGAALLAASDASGALGFLQEARASWRQLDAPYEVARTGVLIGLACRACDDHQNAVDELEAAKQIFERLGAKPDLERVRTLMAAPGRPSGPLTAREIEVLSLLATGQTNRAIAQQLRISERTVARHLSNIFVKIGVSTRSAATAYAYRHNQVR